MNIPNALSLFRIILVPCFILAFFSGFSYAYVLAACIFLLAGITDIVDGKIARKYNQITMLGRFLDPFADKLMVFSALICITMDKLIPIWASCLFLAKEILQGAGGLLLYGKIKDVPPANKIGKTGTFVFYVTIAVIILFDIPYIAKIALLTASFALIFTALLTYVKRGVGLAKNSDMQSGKENKV